MTEKSIIVKKTLDTRNAALFVQTASKYESNVKVSVDEKTVKSDYERFIGQLVELNILVD